jgi:hypothetical protein
MAGSISAIAVATESQGLGSVVSLLATSTALRMALMECSKKLSPAPTVWQSCPMLSIGFNGGFQRIIHGRAVRFYGEIVASVA